MVRVFPFIFEEHLIGLIFNYDKMALQDRYWRIIFPVKFIKTIKSNISFYVKDLSAGRDKGKELITNLLANFFVVYHVLHCCLLLFTPPSTLTAKRVSDKT